jgi:hypothetical protein
LTWAQNVGDNKFWQPEIFVHKNFEHITISHGRVMNGHYGDKTSISFICSKFSSFWPDDLEKLRYSKIDI